MTTSPTQSSPPSSNVVAFRPPTPRDLNFVRANWLKSARDPREGAYWLTNMSNEEFFDEGNGYKSFVEGLLTADNVCCLIAHDAEMTDHLFGFLVYEVDQPAIHYIYVKRHYRGEGIARALIKRALPDFGVSATVSTAMIRPWPVLARKHKLVFNPFIRIFVPMKQRRPA
jgi:GNAT superfamily N-acetyltransferase